MGKVPLNVANEVNCLTIGQEYSDTMKWYCPTIARLISNEVEIVGKFLNKSNCKWANSTIDKIFKAIEVSTVDIGTLDIQQEMKWTVDIGR